MSYNLVPIDAVTKADNLFSDRKWYAPSKRRKVMYKSLRLVKNRTNGFVDLAKVEDDVIQKMRKFYNRYGKLMTQSRRDNILMDYDAVCDVILN
jgi:hypothetical protein